LIFTFFVFLANYSICFAFSYDDIESIDDIYRYYYEGEIDQAQFEYLLQMYDLGKLNYEDILAIGIGEPAQQIAEDDSLSSNGLALIFGQAKVNKAGIRSYWDGDGNSSGNYYFHLNSDNSDYQLKIRSKNDRYFYDNRAIQIARDKLNVTIGNYLVSESYGLTIGRFDYQPSAGYDRTYDFDFWSPINSYYNGLKTELVSGNLSGRFYLSSKDYNDIKRRFAGGGVSFRNELISLGLSYGFNSAEISGRQDTRMAEGASFKLTSNDYQLGGEIAQVKRNIGCYFTAARQNDYGAIDAYFWHYARHFENYNCSGKAASDYYTFYPTDQDIGFRTAQAGETGAAARFAKGNFAFGWQAWQQVDDPKLNLLASARLRIVLSDFAAIQNQFNYSVKSDKGDAWWKMSVGEFPISYVERTGVKINSDDKAMDNSDSYAFLTFGHMIGEQLNIRADIRGYFDGSWRTLISEKATLSGGFRLDIELVFGNNWRTSAIFEKAI
jgi:hypothetical protein